MKVLIKDDKATIAKPVRGQVVDVIPHPKFEGLYQFEFTGENMKKETWMCSRYAFEEIIEESNNE